MLSGTWYFGFLLIYATSSIVNDFTYHISSFTIDDVAYISKNPKYHVRGDGVPRR